MIRPLAARKIPSSTGPISRSGATKPGTSALVESASSRSTPSEPSRANPGRSVSRPSSGSWSILKSPVCSTTPAGVRIATASASGIEWLTAKNSHRNGPSTSVCPSWTVNVYGSMRRSASFASTRARVNWEPTSGMSGLWASRYGTAPMWSSCPCVSTIACTSASRSRIAEKSGRIRSTPGWSTSGNSTPQSTTSSLPPNSKTVMLRPIAPSPPSGMMRSAPAGNGGGGASGLSTVERRPDAAPTRSAAVDCVTVGSLRPPRSPRAVGPVPRRSPRPSADAPGRPAARDG